MYRIVCENVSALRSTLPPRLYLDHDVKVEESSFKCVTAEKRSDMNEGKREDYETTARLCAVSGSCLVQPPRSFIDSFIKGRTNLRVEYNEGQSVSVCSVYSATTSLFPSAASLQSLYTLFKFSPLMAFDEDFGEWEPRKGDCRPPCLEWEKRFFVTRSPFNVRIILMSDPTSSESALLSGRERSLRSSPSLISVR